MALVAPEIRISSARRRDPFPKPVDRNAVRDIEILIDQCVDIFQHISLIDLFE